MLQWLNAPWAALTPRQLAAHTSGLPHYQYVDRNRGAIAYATVRDAVGVFESRALRAAPGSTYGYSSRGHTLLSEAVEARAGAPFLEFVAGHITPGLVIGVDDAGRGHPMASRIYGFSGGRPAATGTGGQQPHDHQMFRTEGVVTTTEVQMIAGA